MLREIGEAMLARGYAMDLLYRNLPPQHPRYRGESFHGDSFAAPTRPKRHYLRRSLAWSFDRSGRLLTRVGAWLRPASETPKLQGCG